MSLFSDWRDRIAADLLFLAKKHGWKVRKSKASTGSQYFRFVRKGQIEEVVEIRISDHEGHTWQPDYRSWSKDIVFPRVLGERRAKERFQDVCQHLTNPKPQPAPKPKPKPKTPGVPANAPLGKPRLTRPTKHVQLDALTVTQLVRLPGFPKSAVGKRVQLGGAVREVRGIEKTEGLEYLVTGTGRDKVRFELAVVRKRGLQSRSSRPG